MSNAAPEQPQILWPSVGIDAVVVRLPGGRRIGTAEWGDRDGVPLLLFHGTPGSRLTGRRLHDAAREAGVQVIVLERPGYGLSDPQHGRRLLDWPRDVAAVADRLGLDRFAVAGVSGGGPYVHACCAALPDRVTVGCVVSGAGDLHGSGAVRDALGFNRLAFEVASRAPWLFERPAALAGDLTTPFGRRLAARSVQRYLRRAVPAVDRAVLDDPLTAQRMALELAEAFRGSFAGFASDQAVLVRPWGFDLGQVKVPVRLWHGPLDRNVPVVQAEAVAERLADAVLTLMPGRGHFLPEAWDAVCRTVVDFAP